MLALPFDRHVDARGQAVSFEDVVEGIFGRRSLAACVDGLSGKVGNASDRSIAVANIQHAERVESQNADASVGVVVEHRCQVGGDAGYIERALGDLRRQLVGRCRNGESVVVVGGDACFDVVHETDEPHGGGAFQCGGVDDGRFGRRLAFGLRRVLVGGLRAAACEGCEHERSCEQKRDEFFVHGRFPFRE